VIEIETTTRWQEDTLVEPRQCMPSSGSSELDLALAHKSNLDDAEMQSGDHCFAVLLLFSSDEFVLQPATAPHRPIKVPSSVPWFQLVRAWWSGLLLRKSLRPRKTARAGGTSIGSISVNMHLSAVLLFRHHRGIYFVLVLGWLVRPGGLE
jgi:hypothetical protein